MGDGRLAEPSETKFPAEKANGFLRFADLAAWIGISISKRNENPLQCISKGTIAHMETRS